MGVIEVTHHITFLAWHIPRYSSSEVPQTVIRLDPFKSPSPSSSSPELDLISAAFDKRSEKTKRVVKAFLFLTFLAFAACRINIGALRVYASQVKNADIALAHSYAYICWGLADLVILGLLIANAYHLQKNSTGAAKQRITVILTSSIPRIGVIIANTLVIVVIGNIPESNYSDATRNMNTLCWMMKGVYPLVLLIDMLMTKESLTNIRDNHSQQKGTLSSDPQKNSIQTSAVERTSAV